jgi:hypothetical protein
MYVSVIYFSFSFFFIPYPLPFTLYSFPFPLLTSGLLVCIHQLDALLRNALFTILRNLAGLMGLGKT